MTSFMLMIVMTIGLLQVYMCTANPVSPSKIWLSFVKFSFLDTESHQRIIAEVRKRIFGLYFKYRTRTTLCDYVSDPHSPSFGPKFVPLMEIRSLKMRVDPYIDRVNIAKRMCCIDEGGHFRGYEEDSGLRDEEMTKFENQWNHFDIAIAILLTCA